LVDSASAPTRPRSTSDICKGGSTNDEADARVTVLQGAVAHLLDAEWWPADVLDLSKGGVSLFCDHGLNSGEVVTLSLHHIPRGFVCELPVRLLLAAECLGAYLLGAAFTRQLTDEEMAGLL
jgi:hypothetical protein